MFFEFCDCFGSAFIEGDDADFCFDEASIIEKFSQSDEKKGKKKDGNSGLLVVIFIFCVFCVF